MMKANELRIGNLVYAFKTTWQVDNTCFSNIELMETYKPIPLTEEWLTKLGFVSNPYADCYDFNGIKIECDKTRGKLKLWCSNITGRIIYLESVHQLQNLYFALTGEELTIQE